MSLMRGNLANSLTDEEQMQMALALSESQLESELDEEVRSFHVVPSPPQPAATRAPPPRPAQLARFDGKIQDLSDLTTDDGTESDELLARQLQAEEEAEAKEEASAPVPIRLPPPLPFPFPPAMASPPFPWTRDHVPPSPGPTSFFSGLTDSQFARELQANEEDELLAANEQPAQYRPPPIPAADNQLSNSMDDAVMRALEESRREAEEHERRALREQQEREYQETLLMDQIRESEREEEEKRYRRVEEESRRQALEAEERREEEAAETEALRYSLELKRDSEIARLEQVVPAEVSPEQEKEAAQRGRRVCMLVVRLANGERLERKFWGDNTLLDVKHFVDLHLLRAAKREDEEQRQAKSSHGDGDARGEESQQAEEDEEEDERHHEEEQLQPSRYVAPNYALATTYPQKKFTDWNETLATAGLCPRALVCLQDVTPAAF